MDHLLQLPDQLALHLKSLRKAAGVSQAELAQRLGVSQSRVAAIERDPAAISVRQLMEILQLLDADLLMRPCTWTCCVEGCRARSTTVRG